MADGQVVFEITADGKHAIASIKDVTAAIEKESKKWDDAVDDSTGSMEGSFASFLKGVVGGIAAAGIGKMLLSIGKDAISAASDLAEVQNVVDVTFGDSASKIETWAQKAGKQYGLTETQAKKYTSTIGAMLKSQGMADDEIVQTSTDLAGLAADMASFYNLDFDTAFQKIKSGITGETEPLKALGINMSAANLEAFRLEKGITKAFSAMSQSEQTALRYQYIMQATADAQGDFARTADGFANASRRMETAMETIKTKGGELLLTVFEPLVGNLASFLEKLTTKPEGTVLDTFADIDEDTAGKMANLESTYNKAKDILNVISDISKQTTTLSDGTTTTFGDLFESISSIEANGGDIGAYISGLGLDVDYVTRKYQEWKEAVSQLTSTVPALTSVINTETGAIEGGTDALDANLEAWKANEEKKLAWSAYYAKERALAEKKASLFMYQLDADAAKQAIKRIQGSIDKIVPGIDWSKAGALSADELLKAIEPIIADMYADDSSQYYAVMNHLRTVITEYGLAQKKAAAADAELSRQSESFAAAEQEQADALVVLEEKYGAVEQAEEKTVSTTKQLTDAQKTAIETAKQATEAALEYAQSIRDATLSAINSTVKGFGQLILPTDELRKKMSDLRDEQLLLDTTTKEGKQRYNELQKQIDALNDSLGQYTTGGMRTGLNSQLRFMEEYMENLEKAQKMGLSGGFLASLSDGSVESATYLAELVADPEGAKEADRLWQQVQAKKQEFADMLTDQKLTADEAYQGMVGAAKQAVSDMNLALQAEEDGAGIASGVAAGLEAYEPEVEQAVNAILAQLERINDFQVRVNLPYIRGNGDDTPVASNAKGLDYVPFDGYLSELHEGEGILTAEENRIWQRFKNGGASSRNVDYDALGATMRENVKAGGNVYLDGRVVGSVISAQQGNSYRAQQRSGFQA